MSAVTVTLTTRQQTALLAFVALGIRAELAQALFDGFGARACHDLSMALAQFSEARGEDPLRIGAETAAIDQWLAERQEEAA